MQLPQTPARAAAQIAQTEPSISALTTSRAAAREGSCLVSLAIAGSMPDPISTLALVSPEVLLGALTLPYHEASTCRTVCRNSAKYGSGVAICTG